MIIFLRGQWSDHSTLVQAVAIQSGSVEGSITNLDFNEMTLKIEIRLEENGLLWNRMLADIHKQYFSFAIRGRKQVYEN